MGRDGRGRRIGKEQFNVDACSHLQREKTAREVLKKQHHARKNTLMGIQDCSLRKHHKMCWFGKSAGGANQTFYENPFGS